MMLPPKYIVCWSHRQGDKIQRSVYTHIYIHYIYIYKCTVTLQRTLYAPLFV